MHWTILGCGASGGVPKIGCDCFTCSSDDPKNHRLRTSVLISSDTTTILVDSSPDFRAQALCHGINSIDSVLYTHSHSDHISGIDDLRHMNRKKGECIPAYADAATAAYIMTSHRYIFEQQGKLYPPVMKMNIIEAEDTVTIGDISVATFSQRHGPIRSLGMRVGDIAYSTDVSSLDDSAFEALNGVRVWIVECIGYSPSLTHANLEMVLKWVHRVDPKLTILTHMDHEIEYHEISTLLPDNIRPAFDGMVIA